MEGAQRIEVFQEEADTMPEFIVWVRSNVDIAIAVLLAIENAIDKPHLCSTQLGHGIIQLRFRALGAWFFVFCGELPDGRYLVTHHVVGTDVERASITHRRRARNCVEKYLSDSCRYGYVFDS